MILNGILTFLKWGSIGIFLLLFFFIIIALIRTLFFKKLKKKIINLNDDVDNLLGEKLLELIKIKTTSFQDEAGYHEFRERLKNDYPLIHQFFNKEKIGDNAVFTYKDHIEHAPNLLFATHIDYKATYIEPTIENNRLYGTGVFDAKSLLFVIFEAVENILRTEGGLGCNLTIVMTTDDETTKEGGSLIVQQFLRRGKFFDLVLEEGSGIVDPDRVGLQSNYAFIGLGVTGEAVIRFKSEKEAELMSFLKAIQTKDLYKARIDKYARTMIHNICRDVKFIHRLCFANLLLFKQIVKKIIRKEYPEIAQLLQTTIQTGEIQNNGQYFFDIKFHLSTQDTAADAVLALADYMEKYKIEYEIIEIKEASSFTETETEGYSIIKDVAEAVFQDIYITPVILTKLSEKRNFDKVSDCVLRFSPLYYPMEVIKFHEQTEFVPLKSLCYGIKFFVEVLNRYKKTPLGVKN
ncbi:MAG: M20/M25/M40 family metallo-hydrolase [Acholeplasmataceae bacterium]|nr:M20/M25/M40 family metallo-hydrolase [Acholeplasmataceae bacterium]